MTHLVLFIRSLEVGGAERQLVALAKGLHGRHVPLRVLTFYPKGTLRAELEAAGVAVEDLGKRGRWDLPFLWRLYRRLRALKPDVLYSWLTTANTLAVIVGRFARVPRIVWSVRASNIDFDRYDWLARVDFFLTRIAARWTDRIICNSETGRTFHAKQGYPLDKMSVIENGIDTDRFRFDPAGRERLRTAWKIGANEALIGLVARLDPMKDHDTFLHAAALLAKHRPDVRFVCVGSGPEAEAARLRALTAELGLAGHVIWAGVRHDLPAVYSALDIASSSSSFGEGFSNAVAEAMACERVCVVTAVGDSARIIGDTGYVIPARNPQALAKAWEAALVLPAEERARRGLAARARIEAEFSLARMIERTAKELDVWAALGS